MSYRRYFIAKFNEAALLHLEFSGIGMSQLHVVGCDETDGQTSVNLYGDDQVRSHAVANAHSKLCVHRQSPRDNQCWQTTEERSTESKSMLVHRLFAQRRDFTSANWATDVIHIYALRRPIFTGIHFQTDLQTSCFFSWPFLVIYCCCCWFTSR